MDAETIFHERANAIMALTAGGTVKKISNQYRQGDVLLQPCDAPKGATWVKADKLGRLVLAEGEVTGHAHVLEADAVETFERDGTLYLRVSAPAPLRHEEHGTITVETRTYKRVGQQEWSDALEPRQVLD